MSYARLYGGTCALRSCVRVRPLTLSLVGIPPRATCYTLRYMSETVSHTPQKCTCIFRTSTTFAAERDFARFFARLIAREETRETIAETTASAVEDAIRRKWEKRAATQPALYTQKYLPNA